ncbi:hemolysin family protein [Cypionkella sp.]|jgi:putative hemolysin|uniref:hemolysin family protein n=1 Tax=Cypionkella sp. TaxID=2811411 RepID=UPI00271EECC3|nr:hemolysin family protein [Cypionkella sp.]MDO8982126.1 hemolysin family protein [Cypionkella sp.]MDP2048643.1 hemolysin family protein [Cypionkella sp.]
MIIEILVLLALIALNGVLAMSEMAIVSSRPARLKSMEGKSKGAAAALRLAENPGRFLSTVQIGITMVGVLSGALSGATLGLRLTNWLIGLGVDPDWASTLGVGGVVVAITYVSLIIGELVPKQLALRNSEGVAIRIAPAMAVMSTVTTPVVWFLDWSGKTVLWLLGQRGDAGNKVTEEEVHSLLSEAHEGGVLEDGEREMMAGVMRLSDRTARALMTPRHEVLMLELEATSAEAVALIRKVARPRMLVQSRVTGEVVGIVTLADVFNVVSRREALDLRALVVDVPVVSDQADALDVLVVLHKSVHHIALVYDEYGHFEGIITTDDVLEAITGAVSSADADEPALLVRADGSLLVSGWMPADEFCDRLGLSRGLAGEYDTIAGLVLHQLRRMPVLGDVFVAEGYTFEVIDLDGLRIDKILVSEV